MVIFTGTCYDGYGSFGTMIAAFAWQPTTAPIVTSYMVEGVWFLDNGWTHPTTTLPTVTTSSLPVTSTTVPGIQNSPTYVSNDCDAGQLVGEGSAGPAYAKVRTAQVGAETRVCYRVDEGSSGWGGKITLTQPGASPGVPSTDNDIAACASAGNTLPGPHPLLNGFVGDPSDPPTYAPYFLDTYGSASQTWVCLQLGSVKTRVIIPGASTTPPTMTITSEPGANPGHTTPTDTASPSGTCQAAPGSTRESAIAVDGTQSWLYDWSESSTVHHVCVHTQGPVDIGGRLTVDTSNSGGAPSVSYSQSDMAACTLSVVHNVSPPIDIRRSATGALPASVCLIVNGTALRVTVSTGNGNPPAAVTWEPNPGTPG